MLHDGRHFAPGLHIRKKAAEMVSLRPWRDGTFALDRRYHLFVR
jgi:hypothetical protein